MFSFQICSHCFMAFKRNYLYTFVPMVIGKSLIRQCLLLFNDKEKQNEIIGKGPLQIAFDTVDWRYKDVCVCHQEDFFPLCVCVLWKSVNSEWLQFQLAIQTIQLYWNSRNIWRSKTIIHLNSIHKMLLCYPIVPFSLHRITIKLKEIVFLLNSNAD